MRWIEPWKALPDNPQFILRNVHFHYPSEHLMNNLRYAMEIHFVHQAEFQKTRGHAVVAVLVDSAEGVPPHPTLELLFAKMGQLKTKGDKTEVEFSGQDLMALLPSKQTYLYYVGSLTTPPCYGNSTLGDAQEWRVMIEPIMASPAQVEKFKATIQYDRTGAWVNARPLLFYNPDKPTLSMPLPPPN